MQKNIHTSGFNTLKKQKIINTEAERARIYNKREILSFFFLNNFNNKTKQNNNEN
jgi:hypothetical protein